MRAPFRVIARVALAALCTLGVTPLRADATPAIDTVRAAATTVARAEPWIGVYRLVFTDRSGMMMDARVIVEPNGERLGGLLLVGEQATAVSDLRTDESELRAIVVTGDGRGTLVMRTDAGVISGTLTIGKRVWTIVGNRAI